MKPSHWDLCLAFKIQGKNIQHKAVFCQHTWTSAKGASLGTGSKTSNAALNWGLMQKCALCQAQFQMFAWQYVYMLYRQNIY